MPGIHAGRLFDRGVLHGNPAEPSADVFFRLPAGTTVPLHWHSSAERMVLVSGEMEVVYEAQEAVVIAAGTYAYGPPRREHHATCVSDEDCVLFIAFVKPVDAFPHKSERDRNALERNYSGPRRRGASG